MLHHLKSFLITIVLMISVLTHAHEDHFGAIIDLWPKLQCKIYATKFSAALFEAKCAAERNAPKIPVTVVPSGGRIELGPFTVEFIPVAHSIPESHALAIHTSVGTVLHTGDWKIDPTPIIGLPTDERRLRELGDAGVLALVGDSTNAVREGRSPSETEVAATIAKLVKGAKGRVAVTTFASNVARLKAVPDAAKAADREVVVVGRAMERVVQVARETGHLDGVQNFRSADYYGHFPADKVLALCTGSQGEARAALARIANNDHPQFVDQHAADYAGRVNLLVAPCVSPWAYERINRWNADAIDPNRSFRDDSPAQESAALMRLVAPLRDRVGMHIDLHETTDTDESEFRPALAARDGVAYEPGEIPDGFYLVDDTVDPQPEFQQAMIAAVEKVTHIAPADANGEIIGSPVVAPGVIRYPLKALGLCAGVTEARYKTTTEVYPDSPRASAEQCNAAQAAAVCAGLGWS